MEIFTQYLLFHTTSCVQCVYFTTSSVSYRCILYGIFYFIPQCDYFTRHLLFHTTSCVQCVYFVNSGSEANDLAMIMARMYTKNWDLMCLRNAYHGMSIGTMGTCGQHTWKQAMPQVRVYVWVWVWVWVMCQWCWRLIRVQP